MDQNLSNTPSFSVIITTYINENPSSLHKCLRGVFRNSLTPSEVILVKDGLLSEELNIIIYKFQKKYKSIFKVISLPENLGSAIAVNFGISHSKSDWIIKQDSDDFSFKNRYHELMLNADLSKDITFFGSHMIETYGNVKKIKKVPLSKNEILKMISYRNPFNNPTMCIHRSIFDELGGYPNIYLKEDWGMWINAIKKFHCFNIDKVLVRSIDSSGLVKRRRGLYNLKSEFKIQKLLIKNEINTLGKGIIIYSIRIFLLLFPNYFLKLIYRFFLRS